MTTNPRESTARRTDTDWVTPASANGLSHRIVVHLPRHTEIWYTSRIPEAGGRILRHGQDYEVLSCRPTGRSYVVELKALNAA
jgi:hypothetical protein